jgi:hypothetical protein
MCKRDKVGLYDIWDIHFKEGCSYYGILHMISKTGALSVGQKEYHIPRIIGPINREEVLVNKK